MPTQALVSAPSITVVGSVNLDLVARVERLPRAGETVTGASFARVKGGKGANQAVACARLGAEVTLVCSVGTDVFADEALPQEEGLTLAASRVEVPTGVALILVDASGENQIAVAPGANGELGAVELAPSDAVLAQLEIPDEAVRSAWEQASGLFCLNAAPARPIDVDPDLTVVNRYELEAAPSPRRPRRASRSARRARSCSRTARRSRVPSRRRSTRWTAPPPATRSPPVCSSRCSRAGSARRRSGGPVRPERSRPRVSARSRPCRPGPR